MLPISAGMLPCTPLVAVDAQHTEARAAADVGRDHAGEHVHAEVQLLEAPEGADAGRDPTLGGISPRRPLNLRLSERRKVRLPMAGEMVPARPCALRSRATTRH